MLKLFKGISPNILIYLLYFATLESYTFKYIESLCKTLSSKVTLMMQLQNGYPWHFVIQIL